MCIKEGSPSLKLGCVEIIKILLAAEVYHFSIFSYQLLIHILQHEPEKSEVIKVVVEFLQENLTNKTNVQLFLKVLSGLIVDFEIKQPSNVDKTNSDSSNNSKEKPTSPQKRPEDKKAQSEEEIGKNMSFFSHNSKVTGPVLNNKVKFE